MAIPKPGQASECVERKIAVSRPFDQEGHSESVVLSPSIAGKDPQIRSLFSTQSSSTFVTKS